MALTGGPDQFLHPYYQESDKRKEEQSTASSTIELPTTELCASQPAAVGVTGAQVCTAEKDSVAQTAVHTKRLESGFGHPSRRVSLTQDDDVDLEALVNDMNGSLESVLSICSTQSESVPLLKNGQHNNSHLPPSGTSLLQPMLLKQRVQRSQPVHIVAVRRIQEEDSQFRTSSLPAIPNPFPELGSLPDSSVLTPCSLPQSEPPTKHAVKLFSEDGMGKVVEIAADMTARDLCQLVAYKSHCVDDNSWSLVEHHPHLGLERCLEDHELVVQVQSMMGPESKLLFRKNYAKYEFFKNPENFFPEQMLTWCQQSNGSVPQSQFLQNFLNTSSCPEIQGFLHVKELGRKSWKKMFVCLRRSGLYYSTKGTSKEPRHLQGIADLDDSGVFSLITCKKLYGSPTDFGFCIKPNRAKNEAKELRLLCAEDEQSRTCWITAFRLLKYGVQLYQNFCVPQQRKNVHSNSGAPVRSVSENSLVAMDFSGQTGRVIQNPVEAESAAIEEGHAWRKRCSRLNALGSQSPLQPSLSTVIHRTQHWFHGRISREEAQTIIKQQGLVDGIFLLRDSQSNPKAFVLTLCHHQKIKHFQIRPFEEDGMMYFSLDDGNTKFTDLIQLVEFYQLNKGILPNKLKHHCVRVAL